MKKAAGRVAYLDGIRGLAICLVVAYHWAPPYLPDSLPQFRGAYVGVDLFLVLSGYIITTILWRRPTTGTQAGDYRRFIAGRARRLYPALLGFAAAGVVAVAIFHTPVSLPEAARNAGFAVTQTTAVAANFDTNNAPFAHTWTLGWEWYFYLAWPLIVLRARRLNLSLRTLARGAALAAVVLYAIGLPFSGDQFYFMGPLRFAQLLVGAALALVYLDGRQVFAPVNARERGAAVALSVAVVVLWATFGPHWAENSTAYKLVTPLIASAAVALIVVGKQWPADRAVRLLGARPLTLIGRISYSVYLWHILAINVLDRDRLRVPLPVLGVAAIAGTALGVAGSYRWLEKPFLKPRSELLSAPTDRGPAAQPAGA